jgi:hypothetical protein
MHIWGRGGTEKVRRALLGASECAVGTIIALETACQEDVLESVNVHAL